MTFHSNISPEERGAMARSFFEQGYNCAQSVVLAFQDITGMDAVFTAKVCAGFGGGVGRMRQVCGCVSGMALVSGFLSPFTNPSIKADKSANYALVQKLAAEYRQANGSIVCSELLGLKPNEEMTPVAENRTAEYYKKRPCSELVAMAAEIIAREIAN